MHILYDQLKEPSELARNEDGEVRRLRRLLDAQGCLGSHRYPTTMM